MDCEHNRQKATYYMMYANEKEKLLTPLQTSSKGYGYVFL